MYYAGRQYRCTIIRGKSKKEMDDLLPAYAKVINEICPCNIEDFEVSFNKALMRYLPESARTKKTLDNHRTEISGKLFGMYYYSNDGMVYESERTQKLLSDNDQPAFFKDLCYKMQFPNGMQKITTIEERIRDQVCIRPNSFIIKLLLVAREQNVTITKNDLAYYVLNSLDVLRGVADPFEVLKSIHDDKKMGIFRRINVSGKASSYNYQHINEQLNYLELANLIRIADDKKVMLNSYEHQSIELFAKKWNEKPEFDIYSYDLSTIESRKQFQYSWDYYFSCISKVATNFTTYAASLKVESDGNSKTNIASSIKNAKDLTALGDEGESIVFEFEKKRVESYNSRLANKVLWLGNTKGLGYDIQSVIALPGDQQEFVRYIEVKSTKRTTCPDMKDSLWIDTLNLTRNEWVAAIQHKEFYSIYRVYFTREGIFIFVLNDIAQKFKEGKMQATPMTYRVDFSNESVDKVIRLDVV